MEEEAATPRTIVRCTMCPKVFSGQQYLDKHVRIMHPAESAAPAEPAEPASPAEPVESASEPVASSASEASSSASSAPDSEDALSFILDTVFSKSTSVKAQIDLYPLIFKAVKEGRFEAFKALDELHTRQGRSSVRLNASRIVVMAALKAKEATTTTTTGYSQIVEYMINRVSATDRFKQNERIPTKTIVQFFSSGAIVSYKDELIRAWFNDSIDVPEPALSMQFKFSQLINFIQPDQFEQIAKEVVCQIVRSPMITARKWWFKMAKFLKTQEEWKDFDFKTTCFEAIVTFPLDHWWHESIGAAFMDKIWTEFFSDVVVTPEQVLRVLDVSFEKFGKSNDGGVFDDEAEHPSQLAAVRFAHRLVEAYTLRSTAATSLDVPFAIRLLCSTPSSISFPENEILETEKFEALINDASVAFTPDHLKSIFDTEKFQSICVKININRVSSIIGRIATAVSSASSSSASLGGEFFAEILRVKSSSHRSALVKAWMDNGGRVSMDAVPTMLASDNSDAAKEIAKTIVEACLPRSILESAGFSVEVERQSVKRQREEQVEELRKRAAASSSSSSSEPTSSDCMICFESMVASSDRFEVVIVPCGHTVCSKCEPELDKCPKCRGNISNVIRLRRG